MVLRRFHDPSFTILMKQRYDEQKIPRKDLKPVADFLNRFDAFDCFCCLGSDGKRAMRLHEEKPVSALLQGKGASLYPYLE